MKFCPMCGSSQDKAGTKVCNFCDYEEKPLFELSGEVFSELMAPYEYDLVEDGIRITAVKNERGMRGAISVPHFVTEIASNAFADCKFLTRIDLPEALRYIGEGAFAYCRDLFDVYIPENVSYVGKGAFADCHELNVICTAAPTQPSDWDKDWHADCSARVEWLSIDE